MKITIHRGIDQIGGCITEIATERTRILIDLGQNLPDGEGVVVDPLATREAVEKLTHGVDAIFYTHYHGDHIGLFHLVPDGVAQYIGDTARQVEIRKNQQLSRLPELREEHEAAIAKLDAMLIFETRKRISVGDITVTPYFVSHSACDAYMFLVEVDGKRILHTGDFRGHGYLSKGLLPTIEKWILSRGNVDFLITEGTMLSRLSEQVTTERELAGQIEAVMRRYKYVFAMCSSTDMERLASFYAANKKFHRPFVCDNFQKDILAIFSHATTSPLFDFELVYDFRETNTKLVDWMHREGFCMLVRPTKKYAGYLDFLLPQLDPAETVLIYSMWKEYVNSVSRHAKPNYLNFIKRFPAIEKIHTSGHASAECLAEVCNLVNPTFGIIPIHSEKSANYSNLPLANGLREKIITTSVVAGGVTIEIA